MADGRYAEQAVIEDFASAFREVEREYGVEIVYDGGDLSETFNGGNRTARQPADWEIALYAPILIEELSLYPTDVFRKANVRKIVICRDIRVTVNGLSQHISGHLDHGRGALYAGTDYTYKVNNRDKQRRALHHALFHMVDISMGMDDQDDEWRALLDEGFEYGQFGTAGHADRTSKTGLLTTEYPGFLNRYSTGHIADDKADIFAYLMVVHHYVVARGEADPKIRAKIDVIKKRMKQFSPGMNESFWAKVDAIRRDVTPYVTL